MSKCIICGKEVDKTYGNSNLMGVYCRSCATENHYTNEQLIEDLQKQLAITEKALELSVEQLDDAKDMLRKCGKRDWASVLDTSADYFKARAKEILKDATAYKDL